MKCESCKKKVEDWVKIPELKIEVQRERHSLGKSFNDLAIPSGMRLLTKKEILWVHESKYAEKLDLCLPKGERYWYEYIEQFVPENKGKRAAWFGCNSNNLSLYGSDNLISSYAARGVRFVRDLK